MVVLSVTNCPLQLRGDLTKWFMEISTGVYVGKINARVRDKIWQRVCENIKDGYAVLVYSTNNEQGFGILTHNTEWIPIDYEGLFLMHKPERNKECNINEGLSKGFSKAAKYKMAKQGKKINNSIYVYLDIETTGLDFIADRIIEVGMLKILGNGQIEEYQEYIFSDKVISNDVWKLTGIDNEVLIKNGKNEKDVLERMKLFIGNATVLGYNINFDLEFINKACERNGVGVFIKKSKDIMMLVKKRLLLNNYQLESVANYYGIDTKYMHRALEDCKITKRIFDELNKN